MATAAHCSAAVRRGGGAAARVARLWAAVGCVPGGSNAAQPRRSARALAEPGYERGMGELRDALHRGFITQEGVDSDTAQLLEDRARRETDVLQATEQGVTGVPPALRQPPLRCGSRRRTGLQTVSDAMEFWSFPLRPRQGSDVLAENTRCR
jgi:hypothetical protein